MSTPGDKRHVVARAAALAGSVALAVVPGRASADGGGPILILCGPVVFLVAQVWIVAVELYVLRRLVPQIGWRDTWGDVTAVNLRSYVLVGLLFPIAFSVAVPLVGAGLGFALDVAGFKVAAARVSSLLFGFGGWVVDSEDVVRGLRYGVVGWFIATFFLSARVEGRALARRWAGRGFASSVPPMRASWLMNAASYAGLTLGIAWIEFEFFRMAHRG